MKFNNLIMIISIFFIYGCMAEPKLSNHSQVMIPSPTRTYDSISIFGDFTDEDIDIIKKLILNQSTQLPIVSISKRISLDISDTEKINQYPYEDWAYVTTCEFKEDVDNSGLHYLLVKVAGNWSIANIEPWVE